MNMNIEPEKWAEKIAQASIEVEEKRWSNQKLKAEAEEKGLKELKKTLTGFRNSIRALNGIDGGMVKNSVTTSDDKVANITSNGKAVKSSYNLKIAQLASNHKIRYQSLNDAQVASATGSLKLKVAGKDFTIEVDKLRTLEELADAINLYANNNEIAASIYRINGQQQLVLSSHKSGKDNEIEIDPSSSPLFIGSTELSPAQNAKVTLDGIDIESDSNKLTTVPGVSIELKKETTVGTDLHFSVAPDESGTEEQTQKFVEAYNTLKSSLKSLMRSGSDSEKIERGAFAGDSALAQLDSQLYRQIYSSPGRKPLSALGITTQRDGTLSIDSKRLKESLTTDFGVLAHVFNGPEGLIKGMEKALFPFLSATKNKGNAESEPSILQQRQNSLDIQLKSVKRIEEQLKERLDKVYKDNLKKFSDVKTAMAKIQENSMSMMSMLMNR
ncbi:flagellar filament capping protein FliD [Candidatus Fukatsuia symbiotica]|uniref:Flagellar hook-associated protein 2 n=1 Tax=Candidatus Fukatsuia symbiotica TaxID=1878942 RepID=A0A2U8I633_9GAMM|nr:flagellar filament capping protein FliD [Candidatus Fukatsuia symbiotica]AWK14631.1 hypothetical protein CCS41_09335 [Candidatus Fukatsuia symbiotica]MEA9444945.1 flagellar filament capping protein FliD [Candidatus Fukatsuia symbiotica]